MKRKQLFTAIALSIGLATFTGASNAAVIIESYEDSVEYSQYRGMKSTYTLRASDIIGANLENAKGEGVGEVDDLIVSRKDDKLMAIISVGGFLGIGDRLVSIPYEDLRIGKEADSIFLDASQSSLEKMPEFEYEEGESSGYEVMTIKRGRAGSKVVVERVGYANSVEYSQFRNEDSNYKLRVSDILGEEVENATGDNIGEVDDLIISRTGNKGLQAVVSVGGFLGIDDKLVTVPYSEMRLGGNGDELYLAATEATLKARPAFAYNDGESTGMKLINKHKRYMADVKQGLDERADEAKAQLKEVEVEADSTINKLKDETKSMSATAMAAGTKVVNSFKESVGYSDAREAGSPYHLRMSEIIGEDVKNANDEEIGEIDDVIMSRKDDFLMAIISVGGFLGMGDKLVSVPYNELRISKDGDDIYIDSTKEKLKARAEFKYNEGEMSRKDVMQQRNEAE